MTAQRKNLIKISQDVNERRSLSRERFSQKSLEVADIRTKSVNKVTENHLRIAQKVELRKKSLLDKSLYLAEVHNLKFEDNLKGKE